MGKAHSHQTRDRSKSSLSQTPKKDNIVPDGRDIEFSRELADHDDIEAQERSKAADRRAKK
jgi:hypothetical protein